MRHGTMDSRSRLITKCESLSGCIWTNQIYKGEAFVNNFSCLECSHIHDIKLCLGHGELEW